MRGGSGATPTRETSPSATSRGTASRGMHPIVLASDFGQSANQPWRHAFDVNETLGALTANKAQTQVFLVDACREITTRNVEVPNAPATWTVLSKAATAR